jgi:hypothetical protein
MKTRPAAPEAAAIAMKTALTIKQTGAPANRKVKDAVAECNQLLRDLDFYEAVAVQPGFMLASHSPAAIAELMRTSKFSMRVGLYHAANALGAIDGYDDLEDPLCIHLNIWRLDRSVASICNTLLHACVHAVNAKVNQSYLSQYYFGHGPARTPGKEKSAPYAIGAVAQQLLSGGDAILLPLEHDSQMAGGWRLPAFASDGILLSM